MAVWMCDVCNWKEVTTIVEAASGQRHWVCTDCGRHLVERNCADWVVDYFECQKKTSRKGKPAG